MLGSILSARLVYEQRLPDHGLQFVDFNDEGELLLEAGHRNIVTYGIGISEDRKKGRAQVEDLTNSTRQLSPERLELQTVRLRFQHVVPGFLRAAEIAHSS